MLIAIDGAQSSGKTTAWTAVRSMPLSADVTFIPEVARLIAPDFGVHSTEDWEQLLGDRRKLERFFNTELSLLRQLTSSCNHAVIDSSALLITAYATIFLGVESLPPAWASYDVIFYCEPWPSPADDGFRFVHGREVVDSCYRHLLQLHSRGARVQALPANEHRLTVLRTDPVWQHLVI